MNLQMMKLRKNAGYKSRDDFATALNVATRRIAALERQEMKLSLEEACEIADVLACTLDELAGRTPPEPYQYIDRRQQDINNAYEKLSEQGKSQATEQMKLVANTYQVR